MTHYECIFDVFDYAIKNNGLVKIENYSEDKVIKTATDAHKLLDNFFKYHFNLSWIAPKICFSKSRKETSEITKKQRDELKRLNVVYDGHGLTFDLYALLHVTDRTTKDAFKPYICFFEDCKQHIINCEVKPKIRFLNQHAPTRLTVHVDDSDPMLKERLESYMENPELKAWFHSIALGLGQLSWYSGFSMRSEDLLNYDEEHELYLRNKERRKLNKEQKS